MSREARSGGANPHMAHAELFMSQGRLDRAEGPLRQALAHDPYNPMAHAWLALCLAAKQEFTRASEEAEQAVALAPDMAYAHYVRAAIFRDRGMPAEATQSVQEAIRLEPDVPSFWALFASLHADAKKWSEALAAADQGLQFDAEHQACINVRGQILTAMGRRAEARDVIDAAIKRRPDSAEAHANMGWTLLHQGRHREALERFREALRLDPGLDWARQGVIEALKARHFIYRIFLAYVFWMARWPANAQWGILIVGFLGHRILNAAAARSPDIAPFVTPITILYMAFCFLTIFATPLFNLLLKLNRFGRLALNRHQSMAATALGIATLPPLGFLAAWLATSSAVHLDAAFLTGILLVPIASAGLTRPGRPTQVLIALASVLTITCAWQLVRLYAGAAPVGVALYSVGCMLSVIAVNIANTMKSPVRR